MKAKLANLASKRRIKWTGKIAVTTGIGNKAQNILQIKSTRKTYECHLLIAHLDIREKKQPIGGDQTRDQRRQRVIVAESQLVDRDRVVLIDDGHNAELEQAQKRVLRVAICKKTNNEW